MKKRFFDLDSTIEKDIDILDSRGNDCCDIAIIGMSGKIGISVSIEDFWNKIVDGSDFIIPYPKARMQDALQVFPYKYEYNNTQLYNAGYLSEIDKFDYEFFNMSYKEAMLTDPRQRILLETIWSAIEDSGYSARDLHSSMTGVFIGQSNDLDYQYYMYINDFSKEEFEQISLPGNIQSVLASRISYLLDLKGPSMVIDTACSSSLVALHQACESLIHNDCSMAIVGGIKINILPKQYDIDNQLGIRSEDACTRAFDDDASGFGSGEGSVAVLLKPLGNAIRDNDNIHAIIKGVSINQDGASLGLTAPNANSQEEVIIKAWEKAKVNPESISYIEAHGTGTRLGDPIEISGIKQAFKHYTTKKNICGIGSIKSNVGHLDSAAALPGLIKIICAMKHRVIPGTKNFITPNRRIDFIDSPLYICDRTSPWLSSHDGPLRAGLSSFGLSGTNGHVILQEYLPKPTLRIFNHIPKLFILSAKNHKALQTLILLMINYLEKGKSDCLDDVCYTLAVGRVHHSYRLAIIVDNSKSLLTQLKYLVSKGDLESCEEREIFFSFTKDVNLCKYQTINDRTDQSLDLKRVDIRRIGIAYTKGYDIDWNEVYNKSIYRRLSLPSYPFTRSRCWIEIKKITCDHSLLDYKEIISDNKDLFTTAFSLRKHWIIDEHKISGKSILPGTGYVEIIQNVSSERADRKRLRIDKLYFNKPFILLENKEKILKLSTEYDDGGCSFSFFTDEKNIHAEGHFLYEFNDQPEKVNVKALKKKYNCQYQNELMDNIIELGSRWITIERKIFSAFDGYLVSLKIGDNYIKELDEYFLHPALMDRSVNAISSQFSKDVFLPLSYYDLTIYKRIPAFFYTLIIPDRANDVNKETKSFYIKTFDIDGEVIFIIKKYIIKRIENESVLSPRNTSIPFYKINYIKDDFMIKRKERSAGNTILFYPDYQPAMFIQQKLQEELGNVIKVKYGDFYKKISRTEFITNTTKESISTLFDEIQLEKVDRVVFIPNDVFKENPQNRSKLKNQINTSINIVSYIFSNIIHKHPLKKINIILITSESRQVSGNEDRINPVYNALIAFGKSILQENYNFQIRAIDCDLVSFNHFLVDEILNSNSKYLTYLRNNSRYYEEMAFFRDEIRNSIFFKQDGVYIVTGGYGDLGFEIVKHLVKNGAKNIVILSRTKQCKEIEDANKDKKRFDRNNSKFEVLNELKNQGIDLCSYEVDISDSARLSRVFTQIRNDYGYINGVVHCAGIIGSGLLLNNEELDFDIVFAAKIYGTYNLYKMIENDHLDFFILFSSITSLLADPTQSDYVAANAYMDAFAENLSLKGVKCTSINWPAWKEVGMAVRHDSLKAVGLINPLSTQDALLGFNHVIKTNPSRCILGELNLNYIENNIEFPIKLSRDLLQGIKNDEMKRIRVVNKQKDKINVISKNKLEEITATEHVLVDIWSDLLGLYDVDINIPFHLLGGDSIMAIRLVKRLEALYPGKVDITDVFSYPSIHEMGQHLDRSSINSIIKGRATMDIEQFFDQLERGEMTVEQAKQIL